MSDADEDKQWYVNTRTGVPEQGMVSPITQRMGPYASYEDALRAREIVEERNALWDAQTKAWNSWDGNEADVKRSDSHVVKKPADGTRTDGQQSDHGAQSGDNRDENAL